MRRYMFLRVGMLAAIFAAALCLAGQASAFDAKAHAARILAAEKAGAPQPLVAREIAMNEDPFAYGVQDAYVLMREKEGEVRAGYKAIFTKKEVMDKFGAKSPASGVLFKAGRYIGSPIIAADTDGLTLEPEIGFRLVRPITAKIASVEDLKGYVGAVFPAIEIPRVNYAGKNPNYSDLICGNGGSYKFITGSYLPIDRVGLGSVRVEVDRDGKPYVKGTSESAMGDPWKALLWLVNDVVSRGGKLTEGDILLTGAMAPGAPATVGKYSADFGELGKITFQIYPLIN